MIYEFLFLLLYFIWIIIHFYDNYWTYKIHELEKRILYLNFELEF